MAFLYIYNKKIKIWQITDHKKYFIRSSLLMALYTAWTWKMQQHSISRCVHPALITWRFNQQIAYPTLHPSRNKLQVFYFTERERREGTAKKTCSLETTWMGPIFTDTYLPPDDDFCLTYPCNGDVQISSRSNVMWHLTNEPQLLDKITGVIYWEELNHPIFHNFHETNSWRQSHHSVNCRVHKMK